MIFFTPHVHSLRPQPRQQRRAADHRSLPRQHRFGLGDRLIGHLYHLLEQLVLARYARAKLPILKPLKAHYEHASRLITAIAKQHSGWLSQQLQQQPAEHQHA